MSKTEKFGQCRRKSWSSRVASSDGKDLCVIRWNQVALALPFSNHVWLPAANSPAVCHRNCISCAAVWSAVLISLMADLSRVSAAVLLAKLMNFAPQFSVWCRARTICHVAESMKILAIPFYTSCHNPPVFNTLILCLWNSSRSFHTSRSLFFTDDVIDNFYVSSSSDTSAKIIKHLVEQTLNKAETGMFSKQN